MDVNSAIDNFRDFLNAGYGQWLCSSKKSQCHDDADFDTCFDDWAQANWELLVERPLCGRTELLSIYGAGSDYEETAYSRVFFRDMSPTHEVECRARGELTIIDRLSGVEIDPVEWNFDRLAAFVDGWHSSEPPFDHVLLSLDGREDALVSYSRLEFRLRRMK